MKVLKGISAASGVVEGLVCVYDDAEENIIPRYAVSTTQVDNEVNRVLEAFKKARQNMEKTAKNAKTFFDKEVGEIFNAHLLILSDNELIEKACDLVRKRKINAEHAINDAFEEYISMHAEKQGHFKELIHDFMDTRNRVMESIGSVKSGFKCDMGNKEAVIVAAKRLTPSMVLKIPRENVSAFLSEEGGFTSHAIIIARSYGVPIIFGLGIGKELDCGKRVIVDGSLGKVIIDPDKKTKKYYKTKIENIKKKKQVCEVKKDLLPQTKSGMKIKLKVNISTFEEYELAKNFPHDGIGLLRTEFLFMQREIPPGEDEQYRLYKKFFQASGNKPVTVRLLDIGMDKIPPYLNIPEQAVLDMGLRGAVAVETFPGVYLTQIRALLRASEGGNLRLLYPMVSDLDDLKTFREALKKAKRSLKKEKIKFNPKVIQEGLMVETPGAVMMVQELLQEVDFVNIGSNDLLQYTLAALRGNMLVEKRYHIMHPAVIKFIEIVAKAAKKVKKEACLCGEVSSFEEYYPLLIHLGLRSFSVAVSKFEDIKCELLHIHESSNKDVVKDYLQLKSRKEEDTFFTKFI